jgi:hypothetical protein
MDFVKTDPPFPQEHKLKGRSKSGLFLVFDYGYLQVCGARGFILRLIFIRNGGKPRFSTSKGNRISLESGIRV